MTPSAIDELVAPGEALEQWVAILCSTLEATSDGILVVDQNDDVRYCNETFLRQWNLDRQWVQSRPHGEVARVISQQFPDPKSFIARVRDTYAMPEDEVRDMVSTLDERVYERLSKLQRVNGRVVGRVWSFRDITKLHELTRALEQRVVERTKALAHSELQLAQLVNGVRDCAIYMLDCDGRVASWNPGAERIKGYSAAEIIGQNFSLFYTPEDRANEMPARALRIAMHEGKFEGEAWRMRKDGTRFWASVLIDPIHDHEGRVVGFAKITRDMTERRAMQEQLHQAQKMEAIGQLTGGVAHDFNNLLTVILGNLESIARHAPDDMQLQRATEQATRGAQRAATLTQQLLAFARRQPLNPKPSDVNVLVTGMTDLIRRTLGESISVETRLESGLWPVEVDPHQLESAILNLAVNSRDAMREGGKLIIQTNNFHLGTRDVVTYGDVAPGDYVRLCVTDTGVGMSTEVLAHAFDPFFTTKPLGEGTGLGLSQVFGFVKQSGGHLGIDSELGSGTSVRIYLPRREGDAVCLETESAIPVQRGRANESILVVEDDDDVRIYSTGALREIGFSVLEAPDAKSALHVLEQHPEVRLIFTDVGLPGMDGRQLVEQARRLNPGVKVLFTSGYALQAIVHDGRLDPGVELLTKPFTRTQLAGRIREVLDKPAGAAIVSKTRAALVVDDEILIGMYLADVLEELGYRVTTAGSAKEGLAALDAGSFDVAFVDIGLPDLNGIDLVRQMRSRLPQLKIALASGYAESTDETLKGDANVTFLAKPFDSVGVQYALQKLNA